MSRTPGQRPQHQGFTLVELIVVLGIMLILLGMLGLSLAGSANQRARWGAINLVLNTFEQARVAALESGAAVHVGFADRDFPLSTPGDDVRYRKFIVFRERTSSDSPAVGPGVPRFVCLTAWRKLPRGVSFKSENNSIVNRAHAAIDLTAADCLPGVTANLSIPVLSFTSAGTISAPASSSLQLFLYEGFFNGSVDVVTGGAGSGLFERFEFARFTGRVRHEVSSLVP